MHPGNPNSEGAAAWLSEKDAGLDFGPLQEERLRIDRIVSRLDVTDDLTERADLASELVRSVSRYEDTIERAPPRTAVGRFFSNAHVKLDHTFEDVATPSHPGADTING
jgi:hypothetical protein